MRKEVKNLCMLIAISFVVFLIPSVRIIIAKLTHAIVLLL